MYTGDYEYVAAEHSEIASMNGNNQTFRYNVFTHMEGTGGLMFNGQDFYIYGNVFYHAPSDTSWDYAANGIIGAKSSNESVKNTRVFNNTFINSYSDGTGGGGADIWILYAELCRECCVEQFVLRKECSVGIERLKS